MKAINQMFNHAGSPCTKNFSNGFRWLLSILKHITISGNAKNEKMVV